MNECLLETTAAIAIMNGDAQLEHTLNQIETTYVPSIALGELYFGAEKSARREENIERIRIFSSSRTILVCDHDTAQWYGKIADGLRVKGRPIPQNDIWIAAIAMQHDLALLTRDAHFGEIDDLSIVGW